MLTEITIQVQAHDRLYADHLRILFDRFGLIAPEVSPNTFDIFSATLGFRIVCEAYSEGAVVARKEYEGEYTGQTDPANTLKGIALGLFPDSQGNPLTETPL